MIFKFQQGGFMPQYSVYEHVSFDTPSQTKKSTNNSNEDQTKDLLKLFDNLKDKVLPGDLAASTGALVNLFNSMETKLKSPYGTSSIASEYLQAINYIANLGHHHNQFIKARDTAIANGSLNEIVANSNGLIMVQNLETDDYDWITPEKYKTNEDIYRPISNQELLKLRAQGVGGLAYNEEVLNIVSSSLGMDKITDIIQNSIADLGKTTVQTGVKQGLAIYKDAVEKTGDASIEALQQVLSESQLEQATYALNYIYKTLTPNVIATLKMHSDGTGKGATDLINSLVFSTLSSKSLDKSKKGSTKGSSADTIGDMKLSSAPLIAELGYGERNDFIIQTAEGKSSGLFVPSVRHTVKSKGQPIGTATLEEVKESDWGTYLDFSRATIGEQLVIDSNNVVIDNDKISVGYIPFKVNERGIKVPNFEILANYTEALKTIRKEKLDKENLTDEEKARVNEILLEKKVPIKYGSDGSLNYDSYSKFAMMDATATEYAFEEGVAFAPYLKEVFDNNKIRSTLSVIAKGKEVDWDSQSLWDSWKLFWDDYDAMYQGVVFIPVVQDYFSIVSAAEDITASEAAEIAAEQYKGQRESNNQRIFNSGGNQL